MTAKLDDLDKILGDFCFSITDSLRKEIPFKDGPQIGGNKAKQAILAAYISREEVDKLIDQYSIHRPKGHVKGTLARKELKARLAKLGL